MNPPERLQIVDPGSMDGTLAWVLESTEHPAWALADELARDADPSCDGALGLLLRPSPDVAALERAKHAFKALRLEGETETDRHLGARLYAATIASALVHFNRRISRQRPWALLRAFSRLARDPAMPYALRQLGVAGDQRLRTRHCGPPPRPSSQLPARSGTPVPPGPPAPPGAGPDAGPGPGSAGGGTGVG